MLILNVGQLLELYAFLSNCNVYLHWYDCLYLLS